MSTAPPIDADLIVIGTDTDAGKTSFSLLWLSAFPEYAYWKPLETGEPDSVAVRTAIPTATVFEPVGRFRDPVAPPLAARREGRVIPKAAELAAQVPLTDRPLLIETFGGPLSPLNEAELQIEFIRKLKRPCVLVDRSTVGAIGRTLNALRAVRDHGAEVLAVVLTGTPDPYAVEQIERHGQLAVFGVDLPARRDPASLRSAVPQPGLTGIRDRLAAWAARPRPDLIADDAKAVWHPYTSLRDPDPPLPVLAADREFLELADGERVIDGVSSWWTILHGHRHPPLVEALRRASSQLDHVLFAGATHPAAVEAATRLLTTTGWSGGRVFFSDNGSTAVEVALKMAYQFWCHQGEPQRTLFVGFEGAYHGDTFGAMAVSRDRVFFNRFEPLLFRAVQVPVASQALAGALAAHASEVAGVIIEPLVQGAGGMRMHSPETLRQLHEVTRQHGLLFIADEVMTACRTGSFWAHSQAAVQPDLICAAKTLAGGMMPLAATLAAPKIVEAFDTADRSQTFFHGHSFTAHPLACAVAVANLAILEGGQWLDESARIHQVWRDQVPALRNTPRVREVRTCGTILAVEVEAPGGYLADAGRAMKRASREAGVLLRPLGNVLYAMPPLGTSNESLKRIVHAMQRAILAVQD